MLITDLHAWTVHIHQSMYLVFQIFTLKKREKKRKKKHVQSVSLTLTVSFILRVTIVRGSQRPLLSRGGLKVEDQFFFVFICLCIHIN